MSTPQLVLPYVEGEIVKIMDHMLDQYLLRTNDEELCKADKVYTYADEDNFPNEVKKEGSINSFDFPMEPVH